MLFAIWRVIGILVGMCILIPLLIFVVAMAVTCIDGLLKLCIATADVIATWINEKINKK